MQESNQQSNFFFDTGPPLLSGEPVSIEVPVSGDLMWEPLTFTLPAIKPQTASYAEAEPVVDQTVDRTQEQDAEQNREQDEEQDRVREAEKRKRQVKKARKQRRKQRLQKQRRRRGKRQ